MNSKEIEGFLNSLHKAKTDLPLEEANVKNCEDKQQDLEHRLELEELGYHECARIAKEIINVRRERRKSKDKVELLTPIVTYYENNKRFFDQLMQLLGEVRKIEKRHETRTYRQKALG